MAASVAHWIKNIRGLGGWGPTVKRLAREGKAVTGTLMGTDSNGNQFYENKEEIYGAHRFVVYKEWDYDASSVTPAWHKWLHSMANDVPSSADVTHKWQAPGTPNLTATPNEYVPYSTVQPKLHSWVPPKN